MKLLIITQKVDKNDSILGFFHRWIEEFAKNCEKITVICLYKGECSLPENVKVLSLGKEKGVSRLKYLFNFYKYIIKHRKEYNSVFVHMNQIYVILGGLLWKMMNKKIALWYTHKNVSTSLKLAEKITDIVFTASKNSFRLSSKKVKVMGHGIDVSKFCPADKTEKNNSVFNIITVGRISPVKKYEELIETVDRIISANLINKKIKVKIIGGAVDSEGEKYFSRLKKLVEEKKLEDVIFFTGALDSGGVIGCLQDSDLFVHMSQTGSLDKVVLEAMACGVLVLSNNESVVSDVFKNNNLFCYKNIDELLANIKKIVNLEKEKLDDFRMKNRQVVSLNHNLSSLINKILLNLK